MRIVTLEPYLTELVICLGLESSLVGVSSLCAVPDNLKALPRLTRGPKASAQQSGSGIVEKYLSLQVLDTQALAALKPDLILTRIDGDAKTPGLLLALRQEIERLSGTAVKIFSHAPQRLEEIYEMFWLVGKESGAELKGRDIAQRTKSQLMDWADNFYERMKNKRVSFLSGYNPLSLAGYWLPDLIKLCSAQPQNINAGEAARMIRWEEIISYRPDVVIVAPQGQALNQVLPLFKQLEKLPHWEDIPAVKRGEVIFCDGQQHFYHPVPKIVESVAVLVSAIAGLESGYITPRDSFYRLRWLEMHRDKY